MLEKRDQIAWRCQGMERPEKSPGTYCLPRGDQKGLAGKKVSPSQIPINGWDCLGGSSILRLRQGHYAACILGALAGPRQRLARRSMAGLTATRGGICSLLILRSAPAAAPWSTVR